MLLVLNTMFQRVFGTGMQPLEDPVNSLSELVLEEVLGLEDGMSTDEQSEDTRRMKSSSPLVWHVAVLETLSLNIPGLIISTKALHPAAYLPENNSEVLLPPPDVQAYSA
ncbi:MAG: hypothetical protein C0424_10840 [Sphingobacteriaceae bacterium]|nr:hypothetical protein [Sphingobacteriaceae bacterium]